MNDRKGNRVRNFIRNLSHKSVWQVLGTYLLASWAVISVVGTMTSVLDLPEWFPTVAVGFLLLGLPFVMATAFIQARHLNQSPPELIGAGPDGSKLSLWKKTALGAVGALALWGVIAGGWMITGQDRVMVGSGSSVLSAVARVENAMDVGNWFDAYELALNLPAQVPDSVKASLVESTSNTVMITSTPEGATVSWRHYDQPDSEAVEIGVTPLEWIAPRTGLLINIELEGHVSQAVGWTGGNRSIALRSVGSENASSVYIPSGNLSPAVVEARLTADVPATLGEFLIDRYEVINSEFQRFVDAGGYENQAYWIHPFMNEGIEYSWTEAMELFVDQTNRSGPATWTAGKHSEGQGNYPVTGISWYEAAAFAAFEGRSLPTVYHWYRVSGQSMSGLIVPASNLLVGEGLAEAGEFTGASNFGVFDMAGNAREWLSNSIGERRFTAGGGWNDEAYLFALTNPQYPFDRSETNGFRLMSNLGDPASFAITNRPIEPITKDFYSETPASDELFAEFVRTYSYDDTPLNAVVEESDTLATTIREKITFDAGYDDDRMVLYYFRPLQGTDQLQTIIVYPGSNALSGSQFPRSMNPTVSMLIRSGRAVAWPIYNSTYERQDDYFYRLQDPSNDHREHVLQWRQDLGRSLDYLQTRPEVDESLFGYYGLSWGGRMAGIMLAVEGRFKAAVLNVPGLSPLPTQPIADPFNFLPRIEIPVLMMNGEYDQIYPIETSAKPFYDFLGTQADQKRHYIAPGGHLLPFVDITRETLDWFDEYLGPTN